MISHQYRCIFIHIPKCAGTSIETALGHFDGHTGRGGQDHRSIRKIEEPFPCLEVFRSRENALEALRRIRHHYRPTPNARNRITCTPAQYERYFKFTFVRNPWSRVFSWYRNVIKDEFHLRELRIDNSISFHDFLVRFAGRGMLRPQTYWLKNFAGTIPLDYIGKFEELPDAFLVCCEKMNIEPIALPHRNVSPNADHREAYDAATRKLVGDVYREEIELFDYSF